MCVCVLRVRRADCLCQVVAVEQDQSYELFQNAPNSSQLVTQSDAIWGLVGRPCQMTPLGG